MNLKTFFVSVIFSAVLMAVVLLNSPFLVNAKTEDGILPEDVGFRKNAGNEGHVTTGTSFVMKSIHTEKMVMNENENSGILDKNCKKENIFNFEKNRKKREANSFYDNLPSIKSNGELTAASVDGIYEIGIRTGIVKRETACLKELERCTKSSDCCEPFGCYLGICKSCIKKGQICESKSAVCCDDGENCWESTCQNCSAVQGLCSDENPCCNNLNCEHRFCRRCVPKGESCFYRHPHTPNCCHGSYCEKNSLKCLQCSTRGGKCTDNDECCNEGDACHKGICKTCIPRDGLCEVGRPCCSFNRCIDGRCESCREDGQDYCFADYHCCDGLTCRGWHPKFPKLIGICTSKCRKNGEPCRNIHDCCIESGTCLNGVCRNCALRGQLCKLDTGCCEPNDDCVDGVCKQCIPMTMGCENPKIPCCLGSNCVGGKCNLCTQPFKDCKVDAQCCCGGNCIRGLCTPCWGSCNKNSECPCKYFLCIDKLCHPCSKSGGECGSSNACCEENEGCYDGKCLNCIRPGQKCSSTIPCCNWPNKQSCENGLCRPCQGMLEECTSGGVGCCLSPTLWPNALTNMTGCHNRLCMFCLQEGMECPNFHQLTKCCADTYCLNNKCTKCLIRGGKCTTTGECCNNAEVCAAGTCKTCVQPNGDCSDGRPCCLESECRKGECVNCLTAVSQLNCQDSKDCCAGLTCVSSRCQ